LNTELTNAERTLLKKVKVLKRKLKQTEHQRDKLKGMLMAAGCREDSLNMVLAESDEPTEKDRYR
jgi:hypothetical protein